MVDSSTLWVVDAGDDLVPELRAWLEPFGWRCVRANEPIMSAAICIMAGDQPASTRDRFVREIRASEGALGSMPILLATAQAMELPPGVTALLPLPLDREATLAILTDWCGPLADNAFRDLANPHYRLLRMAGAAQTRDLMRRFSDQLEEAVQALESADPAPAIAHRIAGAAGMFGFADLSATWRAIDAGDSIDAAEAIVQSRRAIDEIRQRLD